MSAFHPQPKPALRHVIKGRKLRAESKVKQRIRALCMACAKLGWTYDAHGELINEREPEPVSEMDQIRR